MKTCITLLLSMLLVQHLHAQDNDPFSYERKNTFNEKTVYKNQRASGITTHKIVIDGKVSRVPFYFYQNVGDNAQQVILLLHGLGGSKEEYIFGGSDYKDKLVRLKDTLLELGFSLVIPDAMYHGERAYELDFRPSFTLAPIPGTPAEDGWLFEKCNATSITDYLLIMDFFESNDTDLEFSVIGYSMGANSSLILNGIDQRLNKVVACAPPLNRPAADTIGSGWPDDLKAALKTVTPMKYGKTQEAPVLLLLGKQDPFYTAEEVEKFVNMPGGGYVDYHYFDAGHDLPGEYIEKAVSWFTGK